MRFAYFLSVLLLLVTPCSFAQRGDEPLRFQVHGGYAYLYPVEKTTDGQGWTFGLDYRLKNWMALTGKFGTGEASNEGYRQARVYDAHAGLRFSAMPAPRLELFAHSLLGLSHLRMTTTGIEFAPGPPSVFRKDLTRFSGILGGGADLRASRRIGVRLIQIEGMRREASFIQRAYDSRAWGLRLSSGLVFAF